MSKGKAIWLSYDLGLKGDYPGLFTWLDNHKAIECGQNFAFFHYVIIESFTEIGKEELVNAIYKDISGSVKLSKTDRLYIIWRDNDTNKVKGTFINGARKQNPWEGFGEKGGKKIIDTEE